MSVDRKQAEINILQSLGVSRLSIVRSILLEACFHVSASLIFAATLVCVLGYSYKDTVQSQFQLGDHFIETVFFSSTGIIVLGIVVTSAVFFGFFSQFLPIRIALSHKKPIQDRPGNNPLRRVYY
jgi:ABC-type lipoprotein release transport system permease subunit